MAQNGGAGHHDPAERAVSSVGYFVPASRCVANPGFLVPDSRCIASYNPSQYVALIRNTFFGTVLKIAPTSRRVSNSPIGR